MKVGVLYLLLYIRSYQCSSTALSLKAAWRE